MSTYVTLKERGRVTLPPETVERMRWKPGQALRLSVRGEDLMVEAYPAKAKPKRG